MTDPSPPAASAGVGPTVPSVARMYDWTLGGKDNYPVDRDAMEKLLEIVPTTVWMARENRAYLMRVVRYLVQTCGVRQFLDFGSGLPTRQNVHEVAQAVDPSCRVVYTDNNPVVLAHGRALLADNASTTVITADMSEPEQIMTDPEVRRLLDFDQPLGVLYISVLHCLPDRADPWGVVRRMLNSTAPGSYLAVSHIASGSRALAEEFSDRMLTMTQGNWGRVRAPHEIAQFFDGLEVVQPGLGDVGEWRLDLGPRIAPLPDTRDDEDAPWPVAFRDELVDPTAARELWEEGGVARVPR